MTVYPTSNFVTRVQHARLPQALVMMESILAQQPEEPAIFAMCDDDISFAALSHLRIPQIVPVRVPAEASLDDLTNRVVAGISGGAVAYIPCTAMMLQPLRFPLPGMVEGKHAFGPANGFLVGGEARGEGRLWARVERAVSVADLMTARADVDQAGRLRWEGHPLLYVDFPRFVSFADQLLIVDTDVSVARCTPLVTHYVDLVARAANFARTVAPVGWVNARSELLVAAPSLVASHGLRAAIAERGMPHRRIENESGWDVYTVPEVAGPPVDFEPAHLPPVPRASGSASGGDGVRVSAIVSTYAAEAVIEGCLVDLTAQTLFARGELEILVIDSASPQDEGRVVGRYVQRYPERIRYLRSPQREGVYMAWNRGAAMARGTYLTNANTDDRHRADALERLSATLDAHPEAALAYGDTFITEDEDGRFETATRVGRFAWPDYDHEAALHGCFIGPHPMWRRSVHAEVGWFDQRYRVAGDYEMWLRMAERYPFVHVQETLGLYQNAPGGVENTNRDFCARETLAIRHHYAFRAGVQIVHGRYPTSYVVPVETLRHAG